jgi:hydroxymethylbilane synthase
MTRLVLGTRNSRLALAQTALVVERLRALTPGIEIEILDMTTTGDRVLDRPISEVGTKGLFTKELDEALLEGAIDAAVHSMKDLPAEIPQGITIGVVPERASPFDCLLALGPATLDGLPSASRLGTSSVRRRAQLAAHRPDLEIVEMRGNLDTRWRKLEQGDCDALVLAQAGVERLGWGTRVREVFTPDICLPAPCQGTLAVTIRSGDERVRGLVALLTDAIAAAEASCERAFLAELGGGCAVPASGLARIGPDGRLRFRCLVSSLDGARTACDTCEGQVQDAALIGRDAARRVLASGGRALLESAGS